MLTAILPYGACPNATSELSLSLKRVNIEINCSQEANLMVRIKTTLAGPVLVAILVLSGCATEASASRTLAGSQGPAAAGDESIAVSNSVAAAAQRKGPGKDPKDQR